MAWGLRDHDDIARVGFFDERGLCGVQLAQRIGGGQGGFDLTGFNVADKCGCDLRCDDGRARERQIP